MTIAPGASGVDKERIARRMTTVGLAAPRAQAEWGTFYRQALPEPHVQRRLRSLIIDSRSSRIIDERRDKRMPYIQADGARLYCEEAGSGVPIVFVHEFSGDLFSWEKQLQHFSRRYRCIAFNARGYPPSDVPQQLSRYSHRHAVDDIGAVMRAFGVKKAHIVGCSMGSRSALDFGLDCPRMALSLTLIGIGSGADPRDKATFMKAAEARARQYEEAGLGAVLKALQLAPNRLRLKQKNPRAWDDFCQRFMAHSAQGCANITRRVMARRPSLYGMGGALKAMRVPVHVVVGDEDPAAVDTGIFMKRASTAVRLSVVPATGHLVNLEEPDLLHDLMENFFGLVESGRWRPVAA
jgi:pimeloyl-ACP methyl ester carboxylesterase